MRRPLVAAVVVSAALLGLAGCGGDDEGAGGAVTQADYTKTVDGFCTSVTRSVTKVQADLAAAQKDVGTDVGKAAERVGGAFTTFADGIDGALDDLRAAKVPDEYRRFHDGAVDGLGKVVTALRTAGDKAAKGDVQALGGLGASLRDIRVPDPPAELRAKAPACQTLSRQSPGG